MFALLQIHWNRHCSAHWYKANLSITFKKYKFNRYTSFISNLYSLKKIVVILYNYRLLPFLS